MTVSRILRPFALVLLLGVACGKDSSGPAPLPTGTLVLSPPGAGFTALEGGANPGANTITITNGSSGALGGVRTAITYASNQPGGWLTASLSDTTTPSTLTLNATTGSLQLGSYSAFVAISANGATNAPQIIEVVFLVSVVGVFVSESDPQAVDDATCGLGPVGWGTGFHPCSSIAQGINRATILSRSKVLVADGLYDESVTIVNGVSVLGGHQPDTWERHVLTTNTVIQGAGAIGSHQFAVRAASVGTATVVEGFVIRGPSNGSPGGNSYAIYVTGSDADFIIRNNVIFGGRGGPGATGSTASNGALGANGGGRADNPTAYDAFTTTGSTFCDVTNNRQLSNGGIRVGPGGDDISGGRGGGNSCPVSTDRMRLSAQSGLNGNAGAGASGGANGLGLTGGFDGTDSTSVTLGRLCILPTSPMEGGNGTSGTAGAHGAAGAGGSNGTGSIGAGHWMGAVGLDGGTGGNGGGGGGGGAGGGARKATGVSPRDILGGHGGGGGSGGAGGGGGGRGSAGGGAFGLFVTGATAPSVSDNIIVRGEGGTGGSGGNAGAGGLGGIGGAGGIVSATVFCAGAGGKGGDGGAGGHGGGGGGGSGGASYGIYTSGTGALTICDPGSGNVISGGAAGSAGGGGGSLLNPGGAGTVGANITCSFN